jgi:molecular chaperone Hsp33
MTPSCRSSSTVPTSGAASRGSTARWSRSSQQHDYPPEVEALVAEMALLTAMIGQTIKLRWKLSLQVRGDGPIRLIATDFYAPGERWRARAHPRLRELRCRKAGFGRRSVRADRQGVFRDPDRPGQGHRALPGDHALSGGSLTACAETYFAQSEQLPTRFMIGFGQSREPGGR